MGLGLVKRRARTERKIKRKRDKSRRLAARRRSQKRKRYKRRCGSKRVAGMDHPPRPRRSRRVQARRAPPSPPAQRPAAVPMELTTERHARDATTARALLPHEQRWGRPFWDVAVHERDALAAPRAWRNKNIAREAAEEQRLRQAIKKRERSIDKLRTPATYVSQWRHAPEEVRRSRAEKELEGAVGRPLTEKEKALAPDIDLGIVKVEGAYKRLTKRRKPKR